MNKYTPGNPSAKKSGNKLSAAIITIVVCIVLSSLAVGYAMMNPKSDFDFIPNLQKPGKTHYYDMEYERPDIKKTLENIDLLMKMIDKEDPFMDQSKVFSEIDNELTNIKTMMTLAEIRYYTDMTDEFYKTENAFLKKEYVSVSSKISKLLDNIAASTYKTNYERSYFGTGYFSDWKNLSLSDKANELLEKETELIAEYNDAYANPFVNFKGEDIYINSERFNKLSTAEKSQYLDGYYAKYHKILGEIYVELVKVRLEFAKETEQDYIEYAYGQLNRDYTPKEANAYIDKIKSDVLIPLRGKIKVDDAPLYEDMDTVKTFYYLSTSAHNMGGTISEAFDYMVKYGLYEVSYSENKPGLSFQTFLDKYNSPFIFVSSARKMSDFLTFSHEFGHFVDAYSNLNQGITIDNTEIASQAMAYLAPLFLGNVSDIDETTFLKLNVAQTIDMYYSTCFTNSFEVAVYSLKPEEVTLEKLEKLAADCARKLGLNEQSATGLSTSWFEIQHIYIAPMYTVSYIISNDISLQILEKELHGDKGVAAFENLIDRNLKTTFIKDLTESGFESPFDAGRAKDIYKLFNEILSKKPEEKENSDKEEESESLPKETDVKAAS